MKKSEFELILNDIKKVREILTPEQAIQVPHLFPDMNKADRELEKGKIYRNGKDLVTATENVKKKDIEKDKKKNNGKVKIKDEKTKPVHVPPSVGPHKK